MSLTNSMKSLTQEIIDESKKRNESVVSMMNIYKNKRINDGKSSTNRRLQFVKELKGNVRDLLLKDFSARKAMGANMKQSLNSFMYDLRNTAATLLNACNKERSLIAADILGAKAEWAKVQKKKSK